MHRFSAKPYLQRVWSDFGNEVGFDDFPFNIPAVRTAAAGWLLRARREFL